MNANAMFNAVMELDLEPIKMKLMHVESGEGWSREKTDAVEKEYRRFLCLMKMYPEEETAPMVDVDTFWHYHILDTMKYARDCEQAFGYFLHHYPYVGMRGGNDEQVRIDSGERMRTLYEATFGDTYPGTQLRAATGTTAYCAGPNAQITGQAAAYSAGPHAKKDGLAAAYCAGPNMKMDGLASAYCAGPNAKKDRLATAYCAGPNVKTDGLAAAYCAGPNAKMDGLATAYCAGPNGKTELPNAHGIGAGIAYCAGPNGKTEAARKDAIGCAA